MIIGAEIPDIPLYISDTGLGDRESNIRPGAPRTPALGGFREVDAHRLYVEPGDEVYAGQVIGNAVKGEDMYVNPTKGKQLTNTRASGSDEAIALEPAWELTIERGLEIVGPDEYLEITPKSVRLRKQQLGEVERKRASKRATAA